MTDDRRPVQARGLVKRYGAVMAVDHVDLTVERGDVYGFLGPNGAGKTTTLRILLALIHPDEGEARLFGRNPQTELPEALGPALRPVRRLARRLHVAGRLPARRNAFAQCWWTSPATASCPSA
jgi:ABC-type uncharacterized transport system ATPase subunit